jgi:hypothetical protein
MAYLGNVPARSFISFERQVFTIVNSQTAYTLSHSVTNENDIRLVVNNIVQEPGSGKAYTASGTTLTLSAALTNGTDEMYCVFLGRATATNAPGAGSVGTSQLASDAVTEAKIADDAVESEHLNDNVISGQTELAAEPADTDEFLVSDAGTLKRIDYSHIKGGGITNAQTFKVTSNTNISGSGYLQSNIADTSLAGYAGKGSIVSQSSGTFSFSSTGYYLIMWTFYAEFTVSGSQDTGTFEIQVTNDNSSYKDMIRIGKMFDFTENTADGISLQCLVNVDNTSNDKVRFGYGTGNGHDGVTIYGSDSSGNYNRCVMTFIRLGDSV